MSAETIKNNKLHSNLGATRVKKSPKTDLIHQNNTHVTGESQNQAARGLNRRDVLNLFGKSAVAALAIGPLAACSSQISQHGHLLTEADLAQVQVGMSKQQVSFLLGTPDTTATYTGDVYYYISSKMETKSFLPPKEIDRRVVAVYFAPQIDTVKRVAHYGLQDGKVIDFITRETPSHGQEAGLINQLFRGLGAKTNVFGN
ncbi:MAG: outer membrane protein assembly factor BamE [Rhizobiales bacterium]|nr:outer membrane protein assembly factor BamE [Hyphomicrobiales bacterium]